MALREYVKETPPCRLTYAESLCRVRNIRLSKRFKQYKLGHCRHYKDVLTRSRNSPSNIVYIYIFITDAYSTGAHTPIYVVTNYAPCNTRYRVRTCRYTDEHVRIKIRHVHRFRKNHRMIVLSHRYILLYLTIVRKCNQISKSVSNILFKLLKFCYYAFRIQPTWVICLWIVQMYNLQPYVL